MDHDFVRGEIFSLDNKIREALETLERLTENPETKQADSEKLRRILKSKMADWRNKRDFLVEHQIHPLMKKRMSSKI